MKKILAAAALAALAATPLVAAPVDHHEEEDLEALIELMRKDVRAEKADIVAKTMELDADQAAAFWPLYKQYETEWKILGDEQLKIITDYAENYEALTDAQAKDLITRAIALEGKEHALKERYLARFLEALPAKVVARFFQVDNRINTLVDLELSGEIPLVY